MRLIFRHTLRSILRAPCETVIILLTVLLSAFIFAAVGETGGASRRELDTAAAVSSGNSHIEVTSGLYSDSRYITPATLSGISGISSVSGYMTLPASVGGEAVSAAAADMERIGRYVPLSLTDADTIPRRELPDSVIVSRSFAQRHGLSVGDTVALSLLGEDKEYRVRGINKYPLFGSCELLLDMDGALGTLSAASFVFSAFDAASPPYTHIYIITDGSRPVADVASSVRHALSDYGCSVRLNDGGADDYTELLVDVVTVSVTALSVLIASLLVGFSLLIISDARSEQTHSFVLAGAPRCRLHAAFGIEAFVYVVIGTVIGLLLSALLLPMLMNGVFDYTTVTLSHRGVITAAVGETAMWLLAFLFFLYRQRRCTSGRSPRLLLAAVPALLALVSLVLCFILPVRSRYITAAVCIISVVLVILALPGILLSLFAHIGCRFGFRRHTPFYLALRNGEGLPEVRNIYRVLSTVISAVLVLGLWLSFTDRQIYCADHIFDCDYTVIGAGNGAFDQISGTPGTEGATPGFFATATVPGGRTVALVSASDPDYLSVPGASRLSSDGILLSRAMAELCEVEIGDTLALDISGTRHDFVLAGYSDYISAFGIINHRGCGFEANLYLVRASGEGYVSSLTSELSLYGGVVAPPDRISSSLTHLMNEYYTMMQIYVPVVALLAAVGCADLIYVCHRRRRAHLSALSLVGMSRSDICRMLAAEALLALLSVALISAAGFHALTRLFDIAVGSFGQALL